MLKPPSNNMGAQNTAPSEIPTENRVLLDWVSFTLPNPCPENAAKLMHLDLNAFTELDRGGMGYKKSYRFGNITILCDGSDSMGCHVSMSGQGCRLYESTGHKNWRDLFALVRVMRGSFTRLDIAFDTVDSSLQIGKIQEALRNGQVKSIFSKGREIRSFALGSDGQSDRGNSIYLGSPTSRVQFRIYDKAAEQQVDGSWVRLELQLRKERADLAVDAIISSDEVGLVGTGIINKYLSFINLDDSNRSRCSLLSWWSAWLQHTEKLKLTVAAAKKQVQDLINHIQKQYSATLATISEHLDLKGFSNFIQQTLKMGLPRMSARHRMILAASGPSAMDYPF
ncbi:MAG: replication initiation factor domain-containing protein [Trichlorobacter sp.]